jgi:hypothetical protein
MVRRLLKLILVLFTLTTALAVAQEGSVNIVIILDASGSMQADLSDGQTRIEAARSAVIDLAEALPPTNNASLWVYGHRLPQDDPAASCLDIEQVIPLAPVNVADFTAAATSVQAIGYTPIARTLENSITDVPAGGSTTVVLISDGEESCGGDPCSVVRELVANGIEVRVNTIGVAADANTRAQLQCIAEVSGGAYFDVNDADELKVVMLQAAAPPVPDPGVVQVVNPDGSIAEQISFEVMAADGTSLGTQLGTGEFSPGDYTARVNISPPLEVPITVISGETTTIELPEPGTIRLVDPAGNVTDAFPFTVADAETGDALAFSSGGSAQIPAGTYDVIVNSTPPFTERVTVEPGATVDVALNIGTIVTLDANGDPAIPYVFVYNAETGELVTGGVSPFLLPPGVYDVDVQTVPPIQQQVLLEAGQTIEIMLAATGSIEIIGPDGELTSDYMFVYDAESSDLVTGGVSPIPVAVGIYDVEISTVPVTTAEVTVEAGEAAQVAVGVPGSLEIVDDLGEPNPVYTFVYALDGTWITAGVSPIPIAAGDYTAELATVPVTSFELTITAGETTTLTSPRPGQIEIISPDGELTSDYVFVYDAESGDLVTGGVSPIPVAAGVYDLEISTVPVTTAQVTVQVGEAVQVEVGVPGYLEIVDDLGEPNPVYTYVFDLDGTLITGGVSPILMAAGDYTVDLATVPATSFEFTITAGETTTLTSPRPGQIEIVTAAGQPSDAYSYVYDSDAGTLVSGGIAPISVLAGTYRIELATDPPITIEDVIVETGETTTVTLP